jgi:hypothetical protein
MTRYRAFIHLLPAVLAAWPWAGCAEVDTDGLDAGWEAPPDNEMILEELQREQCNNIDDDGNGLVDDGLGEMGELIEPCSTECGDGWRSCFSGEWWPCDAPRPRSDGTCPCEDGDERTCETACGVGTQTCSDGHWSACSSGSGEEEICDNGIDDDCDGQIDEGDCGCEHGDSKPCGEEEGECEPGTQLCVYGEWDDCLGYVGPKPEACNGLDDDCDGVADNNMDGDAYEENDTCDWGARVPDAAEDAVEQAFHGTVMPDGDEDWFRLRTVEGTHLCVPFTEQCCFELTVTISVTEGTLPTMCLYMDGCSGSTSGCTTSGQSSLEGSYSGTCSYDDSRDFALKVSLPPGESNCHEYTVRYSFTLND